ncbi:MAG: zeta toxin family protein [Oscillospiraceae bacterium]|nr:zeta toxin family protein [Oscillospiraceae bacterium]MBR6837136.1 zeta toxin family protein [Oscillospiraceae bacterium]
MADGDFSEEVLENRVNKLYLEMILTKHPEQNPQAFVLGGQPGAGKTGLQTIMSKACSGNLITINADEFRELHPDFQMLQEKYGKESVDYTSRFSGKMTESLIKMLGSGKYNILVEGTLRTSNVPINTCKRFKNYGYNVTLGIMAVKPEISFISTIFRYENMISEGKVPRATPKQAHDTVVAKIPDNLREIYDSHQFDNIVIYNREGECLYEMTKNEGQTPDQIMNEMFYGEWTQQEFDQFCEIGMITQELMENRNASELNEFINQYFNESIVKQLAQKSEKTLDISLAVKTFFQNRIQKNNDTTEEYGRTR